MKQNVELFDGDARLFVDYGKCLITIESVGNFDKARAMRIARVLKNRILDNDECPFNLLVDLNHSGKHSAHARKVWRELTAHKNIKNVAFFGMHPIAKVLASFLIGVQDAKNMEFFATKKEALRWVEKHES